MNEKYAIISCSGEEFLGGTVTRAIARFLVESLACDRVVLTCLPLFLAEKDDEVEFDRSHRCISIDGCDKRCALNALKINCIEAVYSMVINEDEIKGDYKEFAWKKAMEIKRFMEVESKCNME